jgi:hypothetical protein
MNKNEIKLFLRNLINENDIPLDEDYPISWNIEEFKKLKSFNARIQYCQEHLQRLSSGSSRIVYKIDNEKVLKLARNKKGLSQNEIEISYGNDFYLKNIVANTIESDENNLWLEMEFAHKVTPAIFKRVVGLTFEYYTQLVNYYYYNVVNPQKRRFGKEKEPEDFNQLMETNEFLMNITDFIGNYDIPVGDLMKLSSFGLVKRDGEDRIVIIDYGLTNDVYNSHYKK